METQLIQKARLGRIKALAALQVLRAEEIEAGFFPKQADVASQDHGNSRIIRFRMKQVPTIDRDDEVTNIFALAA